MVAVYHSLRRMSTGLFLYPEEKDVLLLFYSSRSVITYRYGMFRNNKYRRIYSRIIDRASQRELHEGFEKHHVLPESIFGGGGPIVKLTYREHFICHWLLTKFTDGMDRRKMYHALNAMANHKLPGREFTSLEYAVARKAASKAMKKRIVSDETKRKISLAKIGTKMVRSDEYRRKISERRRGAVMSEEQKAKISASSKGLTWFNDGLKNVRARECPSGFKPGRTFSRRKPMSEETKRKISESERKTKSSGKRLSSPPCVPVRTH